MTRQDERPGDFVGKVAIVAGGSTGIGQATARRLAAGGAQVVICGHVASNVEATVAALNAEHLAVTGVEANVASASDMGRLVALAVDRYGGLDILVNSAGIQRYGTVVETDEATWDEVLDVNLKGMYLAARAAIPEMRKRGGGVIVNVSSVQAFGAQQGVAVYAASKGGINALTRAMAVDHAAEGIRVVAVCPASVETPMLRASADRFKGERSREAILADWGHMHPLGRIAQPEEVADLIAFLAGPRAAFITGGEYKIDSGLCSTLPVVLPGID